MDVFRRYSEVANNNEHRKKSPIPELPETFEELVELSRQQFKVLWESSPVDDRFGGEYHPGGVARTDMGMECPFCKMKFRGVRRSGCFMRDIFPHSCPNCNFPRISRKLGKSYRNE